jgi:hypothetical protein
MPEIRELLSRLSRDTWRDSNSYSADLQSCSEVLLNPANSLGSKEKAILGWLSKFGNQPCSFGRTAASLPDPLISICLLTNADLEGTDASIKSKIQAEKERWKGAAKRAERSAFLLLATSRTIYEAAPDQHLMALCQRLLALYLNKGTTSPDRIYQEWIALEETPRPGRRQLFRANVDGFAAQGDQRWWNDHRIPGGVAFTINSPGHMIQACQRQAKTLAAFEKALKEELGSAGSAESSADQGPTATRLKAQLAELKLHAIASLDGMLFNAMSTIDSASGDHPAKRWQKATRLIQKQGKARCPVKTINTHAKFKTCDFNSYFGWYHTDHAIRSDFFASTSADRPPGVRPFHLDFTYIHSPRSKG